jgi:hypothetical protein
MANSTPLGTEQFSRSKEYYKSEVDTNKAQKRAEKAYKYAEQHRKKMAAHPAKTFVSDAVRVPLVMGAATLGVGAVGTGVIYHGTKKGFKNTYDGLSAKDHAKNYVKYVGLSGFQDHDNGLVQSRYQYYSNVKFQHLDRNSRDTMLSWFGIDQEYQPTDFIAQDAQKDSASLNAEMEKEREEERRKFEEQRRKEMFLPMVMSTALSQMMRDPAFREYITRQRQESQPEHNSVDDFYMNGGGARPYGANASNSSSAYDEQTNTASGNSYYDNPDDSTGIGNGGPRPIGPDTPSGGDAGEALPLPYNDDVSSAHYIDPDIAYAREQLQANMQAGLPDFQSAYEHSRDRWSDCDDKTLCSDIQTLHDYGSMDKLMKGIESGEITTMDELQECQNNYEQAWAELEEKGIMPLYGDRINEYMASLDVQTETQAQSEVPVIGIKQTEQAIASKDDMKKQIMASRQAAKAALDKGKSESDKSLSKGEPETAMLPSGSEHEKSSGDPFQHQPVNDYVTATYAQKRHNADMERVRRDNKKQMQGMFVQAAASVVQQYMSRPSKLHQQNAVYVESKVSDVPKLDDTSRALESKLTAVEIQQDVSDFGEPIAGRNEDDAIVKLETEKQEKAIEKRTEPIKIEAAVEHAPVAITSEGKIVETPVSSAPKNNGRLTSSMQSILDAAEAENDGEQYES